MQKYLLRALVSLLLTVTLLGQGTWVLAGTTGGLSGTVLAGSDHVPVAAAKVTVSSPSAQSSTLTDAAGKFTFISLPPDTYTVSVEKAGFDPVATSGVTVVADATTQATLDTQKTIKTIGRITSRANADLVKPGQTADVYSVNAATQAAVSAVGGGGGLNNAYSAIATVPGAYVPFNQSGWFQTVHVRGGDYDQTGYELDGIPVNRSFDNYPSGAASSLGQQELQVYTGATPATAEGVGLAGYINQVIRTGTYPGFTNLAVGIGGPAYYHKATFETGGATKSRNFSYYLGIGGYNQDNRYIDNNNGASIDSKQGFIIDTVPCPANGNKSNFASCYANGAIGPSGYIYAPNFVGATAQLQVRNTVANVHFGIPHKGDSNVKDDIQLLYVNDLILQDAYSSVNDFGGALQSACAGGANLGGSCLQYTNPTTGVSSGPYSLGYTDGFQYNGPVAAPLASNYSALTQNYLFPSSNPNRSPGAPIPANLRDQGQNSQAIFKAQYQHNFGSSAYLKIYGYTYYSTFLGYGPNSAFLYNNAFDYSGQSRDYELSSHTRGVSATFSDQLNDKNLFTAQGAYTTSSSTRDNNRELNDAGGFRARFAVAVNPSNPFGGTCYQVQTDANGNVVPGLAAFAASCDSVANKASWLTLPKAASGSVSCGTAKLGKCVNNNTVATIGNATCGGAACQFYAFENGVQATFNTVKPKFSNFSFTDEFKPTSKLTINAGLRYDQFQFDGSNTTGSPARAAFVNSFNLTNCVDSTGTIAGQVAPGSACPAGQTLANFQNIPSQSFTYHVAQPRFGATFALSGDTVLRASYGSYVQSPNAAYEQYNALQQNLTSINGFNTFYKYGFNTPGHQVRPAISYNTDFSLEHHFKGSDTSIKITPFYRKTRDQIQNFYLDQAAAFVSGLNVGRQTSEGVELSVQKGDFSRDGLAALFSFTYTNSYINFSKLANGSTVIDGVNNDIKTYNGFTSFCATNPTDSRCPSSPPAAACYDGNGAAAACGATTNSNPYYNAPVQALLDPGANYVPYDILPGGIGSTAASFNVPYVATLVLNYKKKNWAFTPSLQFQAGNRYGAPQTTPGIDPTTCGAPLGGAVAGDPRYPYGGAAGSPYDATSCGANIVIPDPVTKVFDNLGAFVSPSQLLANMNITYAPTNRISFGLTLANIYNHCFGGTKNGFTVDDSKICGYGINQAGGLAPTGNFYNPGSTIDSAVSKPYQPNYGSTNVNSSSTRTPFAAYLNMNIKL
jgi:hypothetical protein